jgi:hypothetical protein
MIAFAIKVLRCAMWAGMGMGKTSSVLAVIDALLLAGSVNKVIVFAPLRVARDTWPAEALKWRQFAAMRIKFIGEWLPAEREFLRARTQFLKLALRDPKHKEQTTKDAKALALKLRPLAAAARLEWLRDVDVMCANYDVIQQLVAILDDGKWPFDMVVADEATRLKSLRTRQGGKRAQALMKIAFDKVTRWINLTGTPSPNGLVDLYGQTWFLDRGHRLGSSFDAFQNRWFGFKRAADAIGYKPGVERVVFPHAQAEIQNLLRDCCLTMDPKDWFNLDEPIVNTIYIDLPPSAQRHYKEMAKVMFTEIQGNAIEAFAAAAKTMKLIQLCNGAAYIDGGNVAWTVVHDEKLDALESIVEEAAGIPVLTAYHFKSDLARLKKRFPSGLDLATKDGMKRAMAGEGRVWFGHPAGMGHGVDGLQYHSNIIAFFGHNWNLEERLQIIERIGPMRQKQAGKERPVFIYNIVARGTVDALVLKRVETKRSVQDILLEAMKHQNELGHT